MQTKRSSNNLKIIILAIAAILIIVAVVIIVPKKSTVSNADTSQGIQYIKTMEAKDTAEIEDAVYEKQKKELLETMEKEIDEDEDNIWKYLKEFNTVILGDSRAYGFKSYGYLDDSHVLAEIGMTISQLETHLDEVKTLNPKIVLIAYGLNDIGNLVSTAEEYAEMACDYADQIQEMLPDAYVYVQSILPSYADGFTDSIDNSAVVVEYCKEHGYRCLDLTELAENNRDLYASDDTHFDPGFYPLWGKALLMQYLDDYYSEEGTGSATTTTTTEEETTTES